MWTLPCVYSCLFQLIFLRTTKESNQGKHGSNLQHILFLSGPQLVASKALKSLERLRATREDGHFPRARKRGGGIMVHVDGVEDAETTCYIEVAFLMIAWTHLNQTNAPVSKFMKPRKWWSAWRNQNHAFVFEYCICTALSLGFPHQRIWKPWLPPTSSVIRPSQQWKALQIKQLQVLYGPGHSTGVDWSWPRQLPSYRWDIG